MTTLGLGLAGCGAFGAYLLDAVADLPGVRVVACADPDGDRAAALARRHGAAVATDAAALAGFPGVDVVAIATPRPPTRNSPSARCAWAGTSSARSRWP